MKNCIYFVGIFASVLQLLSCGEILPEVPYSFVPQNFFSIEEGATYNAPLTIDMRSFFKTSPSTHFLLYTLDGSDPMDSETAVRVIDKNYSFVISEPGEYCIKQTYGLSANDESDDLFYPTYATTITIL
jgi:hypothetical protein